LAGAAVTTPFASTFVLVTGNLDKWREARRILEGELAHVRIDLPEIQAATTAEVALHKARAAFAELQRPVIVEDAGVELLALGGFPGPFIKFWETLGGLESICRAADGSQDRRVVAVCALGVCTGAEAYVVEGRTSGTLAEHPRGTNGFGWDAIFIPEGDRRTFGEMTGAEKDLVSHRRRAWESLRASPSFLATASR
jgi:non-canonical purine NTP pyrophosphatase (RdgB/HAM1 family)